MIEIREIDKNNLKIYNSVKSEYKSTKKYALKKLNNGKDGVLFELEDMPEYNKVFDGTIEKWNNMLDISNWKFYGAFDNDNLVGACTIATKTENCFMLEGRKDLAVLWDIRVKEGYKNQGIGQKLINKAIEYSKSNGFKQLKIECQNTNYKAVNFYYKQDAKLGSFKENAYADYPQEVQFLLYIDL